MTCDTCGWGGSMTDIKIVTLDRGPGISFTCTVCGRFRVCAATEARHEEYKTDGYSVTRIIPQREAKP